MIPNRNRYHDTDVLVRFITVEDDPQGVADAVVF